MALQFSRIILITYFHIVLFNYGNGQFLSPIQGNPFWPLDKQFYDNTAQLEQKFSQWNQLPQNLQQVRQQNQLQWRQSQVLWRQKYAGWMERFAVWQQDLQQLQQAIGAATGFGQLGLPVSPKLQASTQRNAQKWANKKQSRMFRQSQLNNLHQLYISQPQAGYTTRQFYKFTKDVADLASDRFEDSADYFDDQLELFARGVKDVAGRLDDAFKYSGPIQLLQSQQQWQQIYALWKQKYAGWLQDFTGSWQKDVQELQQSITAAKGFGFLASGSKINKHSAKQFSTKLKDVADYFKEELEIFGDAIEKVADNIGDAIELRFKDKFNVIPGQFYNLQAVNSLGGAGFLPQPLQPALQLQQLPAQQPIVPQQLQAQQPVVPQQQQQQLPSFYRCNTLECEQKAFDRIPKFYKCTTIECEREALQAQMQKILRS